MSTFVKQHKLSQKNVHKMYLFLNYSEEYLNIFPFMGGIKKNNC